MAQTGKTAQPTGVLYTDEPTMPDWIRENVGQWTLPARSDRTYYVQFRPFREEDGLNYLASTIQVTRKPGW